MNRPGSDGDHCPAAHWRVGAFEVKLGNRDEIINAAALNLQALVRKVETPKAGHPAVLEVVTGRGYPYTRPDGVVVVPIGHLGP